MSRAEMRRLQREQKKSETVTYNLTKAQLDAMVNEKFRDELSKVKKRINGRCGSNSDDTHVDIAVGSTYRPLLAKIIFRSYS